MATKPKDLTKLREQAGKSNAYTHKDVAKKDFAGEDETYPVKKVGQYTALLRLVGHAPKNKQAAIRRRGIAIALRKKFITPEKAAKDRKKYGI